MSQKSVLEPVDWQLGSLPVDTGADSSTVMVVTFDRVCRVSMTMASSVHPVFSSAGEICQEDFAFSGFCSMGFESLWVILLFNLN